MVSRAVAADRSALVVAAATEPTTAPDATLNAAGRTPISTVRAVRARVRPRLARPANCARPNRPWTQPWAAAVRPSSPSPPTSTSLAGRRQRDTEITAPRPPRPVQSGGHGCERGGGDGWESRDRGGHGPHAGGPGLGRVRDVRRAGSG